MSYGSLDFAYPWWLSYGHLTVFLCAISVLVVGRIFKWRLAFMIGVGLVAAWAGVAAVAMRTFNVNGVPALPTENFLRSGVGRVLDLGAGTGRSSIMVLSARPQATLVALDLFAESFDRHFGPGARPQDRLLANLEAAGVAGRASVETADMRKLPFPPATFDAVVSAYAMDHLGRDGAKQALTEAHRVTKPGGDFLLILIEDDRWTRLAFGPLLAHGGTYGATWWRDRARDVGFEVREEGTQPATLYFLLTRP